MAHSTAMLQKLATQPLRHATGGVPDHVELGVAEADRRVKPLNLLERGAHSDIEARVGELHGGNQWFMIVK